MTNADAVVTSQGDRAGGPGARRQRLRHRLTRGVARRGARAPRL